MTEFGAIALIWQNSENPDWHRDWHRICQFIAEMGIKTLQSAIVAGRSRRAALRTMLGAFASVGLLSATDVSQALASANAVATPPRAPQPSLFGMRQRLLPDTPVFRKRSRILKSWEGFGPHGEGGARTPDSRQSDPAGTRPWRHVLSEVERYEPEVQISSVNSLVNSRPYVPDDAQHATSDFWSMPNDFLSGGGDCEDYAVTKYASFRWLGYHHDRLRVVLGRLPRERLYHAILTVHLDHKVVVLDNRAQNVLSQEEAARHFVPILSMNESHYWLHYR